MGLSPGEFRLGRLDKAIIKELSQKVRMVSSPFRIQIQESKSGFFARWLLPPLCFLVEKTLGLRKLDSLYRKLDPNCKLDFFSQTVSALDLKICYDPESLESIPQEGPVVVVSNHPFGIAESASTCSILLKRRPDLRILGNYMLHRVPHIEEYVISVDPFQTKSAIAANVSALRNSIEWIKQGGMLLVYPSGTVSHLFLGKMEVTDPDWSVSVARLIRKSSATVVPFFIAGRNSAFFQISGLIHPVLRTAQIPRESLMRFGKPVNIEIGRPISPAKYSPIEDDKDLISYFRMRTYLLGNRADQSDTRKESWYDRSIANKSGNIAGCKSRLQPLVSGSDKAVMIREISNLVDGALLYENEEFAVYSSRSRFIPNIVREIGRLREETFREVGEGTGKALDLDPFDNYYNHLFMWNKVNCEVVGAYRIGKIDRIVRAYGIGGLYTHTLFEYKPNAIKKIGSALEMGRSFIRKDYQRNYSSLLMLWKGIGRYVVKNPRYKVLLGPVSISSRYNTASRLLITLFLRANNFKEDLEMEVTPRNPMRFAKLPGIDPSVKSFAIQGLDDLSDLLKEVECSEDSLPVILKHYLRLGGQIMGFNIDPLFGDCLDGLIYVDLTKTDVRLLERYLGKSGAASFLQYHAERKNDETCA